MWLERRIARDFWGTDRYQLFLSQKFPPCVKGAKPQEVLGIPSFVRLTDFLEEVLGQLKSHACPRYSNHKIYWVDDDFVKFLRELVAAYQFVNSHFRSAYPFFSGRGLKELKKIVKDLRELRRRVWSDRNLVRAALKVYFKTLDVEEAMSQAVLEALSFRG